MTKTTKYKIVVPTRNSEKWISLFANYYSQMGIKPLYLYDTRSNDQTINRLKDVEADFVSVTPEEDRVESILHRILEFVESDWVVRFDDDELPSYQLIRWLDGSLSKLSVSALAISRRDAGFFKNKIYYSRLEDYYFHKHDPCFLDPQWRAFKPKEVIFDDVIHSPGFKLPAWTTVPPNAFFVHFDWMLRSFDERCAKLKNYERQNPGSGWGLAQFYLPELHLKEDLRWTAFEDDQFDKLSIQIKELFLY